MPEIFEPDREPANVMLFHGTAAPPVTGVADMPVREPVNAPVAKFIPILTCPCTAAVADGVRIVPTAPPVPAWPFPDYIPVPDAGTPDVGVW